MHSDIREVFIIADRIKIILLFILLIFAANYSYSSDACPGGASPSYGKVVSERYLTDYESYCSMTSCGVTINYPTSVSIKSTGQYIVRCPEQCLQSCDDEPEKDNECPWGFASAASGSCVDKDNCSIGNSMGISGSCEPDDCSAGSYLGGGGCSTCPQGTDCYLDLNPDPDGGGGGGSTPDCDNYSACRDIALEELACKENDRDHFIYQYIGPDDYSAECETCDGPDYLLYDECQNGACDYGYDAQNNRCWTIACPHGDCLNPDDVGSFDPLPLPSNQDNSDERLSEIITAINAVRDSIEDDETPQKIEELKTDLVNKLESNKSENIAQLEENKNSNNDNADSNADRLLTTLNQIKDNTDAANFPAAGVDYTNLLNDLNDTSEEILCEVSPQAEGCKGYESTTVDTHAAADSIMQGVQNSGIYSALNEFKDISINVTSACPASFRFQLHFLGTYTIDVCAVFEPVVPLIRALFIAFWGLVSFRALTDA